tara:strand:+ start:173 stop:373 length:201 start_codon:yes stop_codon:yes gene_type:complete
MIAIRVCLRAAPGLSTGAFDVHAKKIRTGATFGKYRESGSKYLYYGNFSAIAMAISSAGTKTLLTL